MAKKPFSASAKILILNEKNQLLILRRSEWKEQPKFSRQPDLPGGSIDDTDDSARVTAAREVLEETGIMAQPHDMELVFAHTTFYEELGVSWSKLFYMLKFDHTPEVKLSWEHESFSWMELEDVVKNVDLSYGMERSDGLVVPYLLKHRDLFGL